MSSNKSIYNLVAHHWPAFTTGSQFAFTVIYDNSFDLLYQYALKFMQNEENVQDILQDLFVHLWNKREQLKAVKQPYFYLLTSLRNALLDKIRKGRTISFEEVNEQYNFQFSFCAEEQMIHEENRNALSKDFKMALNKLTAKQREIIYLRYVKQIDYDQIAQIMGISIKGAYKLQGRAIECLRENLSKFDYAYLITVLFLQSLY